MVRLLSMELVVPPEPCYASVGSTSWSLCTTQGVSLSRSTPADGRPERGLVRRAPIDLLCYRLIPFFRPKSGSFWGRMAPCSLPRLPPVLHATVRQGLDSPGWLQEVSDMVIVVHALRNICPVPRKATVWCAGCISYTSAPQVPVGCV